MRHADSGAARLHAVSVVGLLSVLLALGGCASGALDEAAQVCANTKATYCASQGLTYLSPSLPDYPCGDCGLSPEVTLAPTPQPTTEPVSWKPFTVREVDQSLGTVTFTIRGIDPAKLNGRDWNIANVEGIADDGNLLQCHPSVWQGIGLMDAPCQWFNTTTTPTETHKQHNATWYAEAEYRWQLDWSLESLTIQVWENGNRVILIETAPPVSFSKINRVVIGDGVFAGYPGIGVEVKE